MGLFLPVATRQVANGSLTDYHLNSCAFGGKWLIQLIGKLIIASSIENPLDHLCPDQR
ncbi:MAG: hypothetical protein V4592_11190 [Bacteroidota bacterium]